MKSLQYILASLIYVIIAAPLVVFGAGYRLVDRTDPGQKIWEDADVSSSGQYMIASQDNGYIFYSSNYGVNWSQQSGAGSRNWVDIAISSDGLTIVALPTSGYVYRFQDGGSWEEIQSLGTKTWKAVTVSSDGSTIAVAPQNDYIYTYSGGQWTTLTNSGQRDWVDIDISSDGDTIIAATQSELYISEDSGSTWSMDRGSSLGITKIILADNGEDVVLGSFLNNDLHVKKDGVWNVYDTPYSSTLVTSSGDLAQIAQNYYSTNFGATQSALTLNPFPGGQITGVSRSSAENYFLVVGKGPFSFTTFTDGPVFLKTGQLDLVAPIISSRSVALSDNSATIEFDVDDDLDTGKTTDIQLNWGFLNNVSNEIISLVGGNSTSAVSVEEEITNLVPCTSYAYNIYTEDDVDNSQTSSDYSFRTTGCFEGNLPESTHQDEIETTGGSVEYEEIELQMLPNYHEEDTTIEIDVFDSAVLLSLLGIPQNTALAGGYMYDISSLENPNLLVDTFSEDVTIIFDYSDVVLTPSISESNLSVYVHDGISWTELVCTQDQTLNTLSCVSDSLGTFALFAEVITESSDRQVVYSGSSSHSRNNKVTPPTPSEPVTTPSPHNTQGPRDLEVGSTGSDVLALQKLLNYLGYTIALEGPGSIGNETEYFGELTKQALIKFQKDKNITPSIGYFGPITRGVLVGEIVQRL